jgi:flagellar biogenesis protein FliO
MIALFLIGQASDSNIIGSERWTGSGAFGLLWVSLVLFLGLGVGAWFFNRKMKVGAGSKNGNLAILETRPLGGRQFLMVVGYAGERMLLSVCPGRVEYLCALPRVDACGGSQAVSEASDTNVSSAAFSQLLEQCSSPEKRKV